jgi:oxygen-independent coproporphyrinogen-3 oxidase
MYDLAHAFLTRAGWHAPYGSVNFSRRKNETGTSAYFEGRLLDGLPYLGLGNYATSLRNDFWSFNAYGVRDYIQRINTKANPVEFFYELPPAESQAKYVLSSLNFGFVDETRFSRRFGVSFSETYPVQLEYAVKEGLLWQSSDRWLVAAGQFRRMHAIRSLFYPSPVQQWLQNVYQGNDIQPDL